MTHIHGAIRCIVVDDEPLGRDVLIHCIKKMPELVLAGTAGNAQEAFALLHREKTDLMFLDIRMPGMSGLDFVRSLKNPPAVIFTTAFPQYAVAGFELEAVDYLLKPVTFERFRKGVSRFLKLQQTETPAARNFTYFKISGSLVKILHDELHFAQSVKDYVMLHTSSGKFMTHMTMKYLNDLLPSSTFVRIHRSFLVNRNFVTQIGRDHVFISNDKIPVGELYRGNAVAITARLK